ncbi:hypothetical protein M9H77_16069 [Catharanthus roseus]|uniref:Uncharacterized protein n=1 Tax=Catharanthus roseus TaxID=4058 RepID=A0ACC0AZY7_CATRO|nr:hypothetical protein M9H77_16069 [Catharanthus roseus]
MKTSFRPRLKFVENQVNRRVIGLHCTWLVPHTRASSDDVDGFLILKVDPLEEGRRPRRVWPNWSTWRQSGGARHRGWSQGRPDAALMCLDSLRLPSCAQNPHVGGIRASRFDTRRTYREGTLVDEPSRTTSSSSSYSLREIVPEREPIPMIDLSDDELVEGPKMEPVALGIGLGTSIEEDPSEPMSDSEMTPEPEREAPTVTGGVGTFVANTMPAAASPTPILPVEYVSSFPALPSLLRGGERRQETARAAMLERELAQTQKAHAAREKEILELINEWDWLRQFIAQFLGTTRDSVDRPRDELESHPGCSGSQCP